MTVAPSGDPQYPYRLTANGASVLAKKVEPGTSNDSDMSGSNPPEAPSEDDGGDY